MFYPRTANGGITLALAVLLPDSARLSVESVQASGGVIVIVALATGERYPEWMLIANPLGGYSFLKGIAPYSAGVVTNAGFEIERARLAKPLPIADAFARVDAHLTTLSRPSQALCGMELRSPRPFTFHGFAEFNDRYVKFLEKRKILVNGLNPVARTNVAPEIGAPSEAVVYAFSYTVPAHGARRTFVVAGAGELPEGSLDPHNLVRAGESSVDAMTEKARFVLALMHGRVLGLGANWDEVNVVDVYTVHNVAPYLASVLVPQTGGAHHGITWHYARPPIVGIEYEMDVRCCAREIVLAS
jgi:hypothetical protein